MLFRSPQHEPNDLRTADRYYKNLFKEEKAAVAEYLIMAIDCHPELVEGRLQRKILFCKPASTSSA